MRLQTSLPSWYQMPRLHQQPEIQVDEGRVQMVFPLHPGCMTPATLQTLRHAFALDERRYSNCVW